MTQLLKQKFQPTTSKFIVVKESGIHNKGVFAAKFIPKGTNIIEYVGEKITKKQAEKIADEVLEKSLSNPEENGAVYIFELNKTQDIDGNVEWNTARLINHSCNPNCETEQDRDHIWIMALKDIKEGEELSYDYGYDLENYKDHPCRCRGQNCIGYIVGEEDRGKLGEILKR